MYVKITNGSVDTFPYSIGQLRRDNPNVSFPRQISDEILADYGVYSVTVEEAPSSDERTQNVDQNATPTGSGSSWTLGWTVSNKSSDEIQEHDSMRAMINRRTRNQLLADSDWTQINDSPLNDANKALWSSYRQALREITAHANWPNLSDNDWPTQP